MRHQILLSAGAALILLAACSTTPASRIASHREAFDTYPSEVQQRIRAGQVAVGFSPEMVRLALGEPDRTYTRKTESGDAEIWGYHDDRSTFGFGFGFGTGSRHSAMGAGVGLSTGSYDPEEKVRVEFRDGRVAAVDTVKR
jgi:hypothetical protein